MLTVCELGVLLHCYCRPEPHPQENAPAVIAAFKKLCGKGLIKKLERDRSEGEGYHWDTTEKGDAYVTLILSTPEPVVVYADPRNKQIIEAKGEAFVECSDEDRKELKKFCG